MNDELQQAISTMLKSVIETTGEAKAFLLAETPEYVQQLLLWKATESALLSLIGLCFIFVGIYYWKRIWKYSFVEEFPFVVLNALGIGVGLTILTENLTWLQILIAPKVYLVEYAASIIK